ncbi:MAG: phage tail tape measure protein [Gammaproteobacteria bacterium]|nr:phage tail tape measure protein [Gammaproteobacteria bacterium]
MAESRSLQLVLSLKDNASKQLEGVGGQLQKLKPQFKKMAIVGTVAMGAITLGIKNVVAEAGIAEGAMAKFNTVFGDGKDDMMEYINTIRKEMPTATSDIVQMASGVQDLLVPMGIARDESKDMTKGFLDLANKIGAFNDTSPENVLNAIKSGLVGSSEPLKQYGVDARVTALEQTALSEGLLEVGQTLNDLTPAIRTQVTAQALLAQITNQSSDAINGFEENNDSFIRRQQELTASIKETKIAIGNALLPVIDGLLKKVLPVIKKITEWAKENPKLAKWIIIISGVLATLITIIGVIGLILPPIIAGFSALGAVIGLISVPVLIVVAIIAALIAVGVLLYKNWDLIKQKAGEVWGWIKEKISAITNGIKEVITSVWNGIVSFFKGIWNTLFGLFKLNVALITGIVIAVFDAMGIDIVAVFNTVVEYLRLFWEGSKLLFTEGLAFIQELWSTVWGAVVEKTSIIIGKIREIVGKLWTWLSEIAKKMSKPVVDAFGGMWDAVKGKTLSAWEGIKSIVKTSINWVIDKINWFVRKANAIASKGAGALGISIPQIEEIPKLAKGGIVNKPTIAQIGEAGPEAVIPLKKMGSMGTVVNVVVNGDVSGQELVEKVEGSIMRKLTLNRQLAF